MRTVRKLLIILIIAAMMLPVPDLWSGTGAFSCAATDNETAAELAPDEEAASEDASPETTEEAAAPADTAAEADPDETPETGSPAGMTEVTVVDSAMELAQESTAADNTPFFTIDVSKPKPAEELATDGINEDVKDILKGGGSTAGKKDAVIETLEDSGFYEAEDSGSRTVEVTSRFASQRLRLVAAEKGEINAYGAVKAVFYKDYYLLTYESEEAAKAAFDALSAEYGDDKVLIDMPVKCGSYGWGTSYMGMDSEKLTAEGGEEVTVAVCDSGVNESHSVFEGKTFVGEYNVLDPTGDVSDSYGHGTAVAGIIAESTPSNVRIMPIKALDDKGNGNAEDIMTAAAIAEENGADIINLSLGGDLGSITYLNKYDEILKEYDALIVCASGNDNSDLDEEGVHYFPAELESTVCVGAFKSSGTISSFSNYGGALDFAAPGEGLTIADLSSESSYDNTGKGTSYACPYIASAAALLKAEFPDSTKNDLVNALEYYSKDMGSEGWDKYFGNGCPVFGEDDEDLTSADLSASDSLNISGIVNKTYNGTKQTQDPAVLLGWYMLKEGTDYTLSYSNNVDPGTASVTITGKGNYSGSVIKTFTINSPADIVDLPAVRISKPSAGKKKLTAKWKKVSKKNRKKIAGIEIQITGNGIDAVYTAGRTKRSKVIKGLVSKKKYKVRVRSYRYDGFYKHVSKWSGYKTIKVK